MKKQMYAKAKINLTLEVLNKRDDGYHNLRSLMQSVSIYDKITITTNEYKKIKIACNNRSVPCDSTNLCYIAAEKFFQYTDINEQGIDIYIEKTIPSQAGLGGGSADAAATLHILNDIFKTHIPLEKLCELGTTIGADVPFCVLGSTAQAFGIGEILKPIKSALRYDLVITKPDINISTKEAYLKVDKLLPKNINYTKNATDAVIQNNLKALSKNVYNCFEEALNLDEVFKIKDIMTNFRAVTSAMSGSGSAVFGIFEDAIDAKTCANTLRKLYKEVFLCKTV